MFLIKRKPPLNHKGTNRLETKRFLLERFERDNLYDVFNNWSSCKEAARYNGWKVHGDIDETKEYLSEWIRKYEKSDYYHWAIKNKESQEVIGSISIANIKNISRYCEVGYTVASKYWNNGIATEVLIRVLQFLVEEVGFRKVRAIHDFRNKASGRVMEKAGMVFLKKGIKLFVNSENMIMNCLIYEYKV